MDVQKEKLRTCLMKIGIDAGSGAAGAVAGCLVAGPVGAILGGAAGSVLQSTLHQVASDWFCRQLSPKQEDRVGFVAYHATERILSRLELGQELRDDGFFDRDVVASDAEQIFEAALLVFRDEVETKKGSFVANVVANGMFSADSPDVVRRTLKYAETFTYRQLGLLAVAKERPICRFTNLDEPAEMMCLHDEAAEVGGFLLNRNELSELGLAAHRLMGLDQMAARDLRTIHHQLDELMGVVHVTPSDV